VTRDELYDDMVATRPERGELIYVERRGGEYAWARVDLDGAPTETPSTIGDVWMFYAVQWRLDDPDSWRPFFDDLMDEMESMVTGKEVDRCRWPVDDLWPHQH
jgi:hypothetical protein